MPGRPPLRQVYALPLAVLCSLGLLLPLAAHTACADMPTPGHHGQRKVVTLDFGRYADYVTQPRPEGGTAEPEVEGGPRRWWHFFSLQEPSDVLQEFRSGQTVPGGLYGATVLAVRNDKLATFKEDHAASPRDLIRQLREERPDWIALADDIDVGRGSAQDRNPVWRIERHMRVTSISDGVIATETVSTKYFAKGGAELSQEEIEAALRNHDLIYWALAGVGLFGLILVLRRRSRARSSQAA